MNIVHLYKGVMPRRQAEYEVKYISYYIILHT